MAKNKGTARSFRGNAEALKEELQSAGITYGVSIGRRAPMHIMHVDCIEEMARAGLEPVIVVGSTNDAASALFDPVRNPLTLGQQRSQIDIAMAKAGITRYRIVRLDDTDTDETWMQSLRKSLKDIGVNGNSVMHFRAKSADAATQGADVNKPLSHYVQSFVDLGYSAWQSYNSDPADDNICASDIRNYDLAHLTLAQKNTMAAPEYIVALAEKARSDNPDAWMLEAFHVPLTLLDISLDRMRLEAGIKTADVIKAAQKQGAVNIQTITAAATDMVKVRNTALKAAVAETPLIIFGNSVSPLTAIPLVQSDLFDVGRASIGNFNSGEPFTELFYGEKDKFAENLERIKGKKAVVVQSTAEPVAENVQYLLELIHTLKRYGASEVTAVIPFAAFARQDRAFDERFASVAADLFAKQLKAAGADKVMSATLHSQAAIKFYRDAFGADFTALSTTEVFADYLKSQFGKDAKKLVVGAPDGADKPADEGQRRARELSQSLTAQFNDKAMFRISKVHTAASRTKITSFDGNVKNKSCVIIDDMIDGGSTMVNAAKLLREQGARSVICCATHALLTGDALEKLLPVVDKLVITDSVPEVQAKIETLAKTNAALAAKIEILGLGPAIAKALGAQREGTKPAVRLVR